MPGRKTPTPRSYFIRTFGCQMNLHDSEHVAGILERNGLEEAPDPASADLVVFNTCSVRESAEDRAWGNILAAASAGSHRMVAVCGCMAERLGSRILGRNPGIDLVFGMGSLHRLPELLVRAASDRVCDTGDIEEARIDGLPASRNSSRRAWVPVSHGCSNNCSYCIVPLVRGRERSRPPREIESEVEALAGQGVIEITLLGQNVNSYGRDIGAPRFAGLLRTVASVPGIRRVKFETSHPRDLSDETLRAMAEAPEICPHLHLPVQSGSDRVLRLMRRGYGRDYFFERVSLARKSIPGLVLTTDVMVGFPGETEEDFRDTLELVRDVEFDSAYMFLYSPREGTSAFEMNDIPRGVKLERFERLKSLQDSITEKSLKRLVGSTFEVLIEGRARKGDLLKGRTVGNIVVLTAARGARPDSLVTVEIVEAGKHSLRGRPVEVVRY